MRSFFSVICCVFIVSCSSEKSTFSSTSALPNVVYILADDLGYGDLSCLNEQGKIKTPHLDTLASNGMKFTDAHSGSAVCTPTRYGVITGRYAWRSRLKRGVLGGSSPHLINMDRMSVADVFNKKGYHTAMIGKWHLGWDFTKLGERNKDEEGTIGGDGRKIDFTKPVMNGPDGLGFDYYYGHCGSLDMAPYVYVENGKVTSPPPYQETVNKDKKGFWRKGATAKDFIHEDVTPNFVRRTCKYIRERAKTGKPFFVYLPLPSPHTPILPTKDFLGKSGTNEYGDFVQQVDHHVGEIVDTLKKAGVLNNTLVIFTSDNGCSPRADYNELAKVGHNPSGQFRGHKADIFEGGHRVPFLVHWPAKVAKGSVSKEVICLTDLMATAAEITGITLPDNVAEDSFSILSALEGGKTQRTSTIHHSINGSFAIRKGDWKLITCPGSGGWSAPGPRKKDSTKGLPKFQLYNLKDDIGEKNNLYKEMPTVVDELLKLLGDTVNNGRSTPGPKQTNEGETVYQ